MSALTPFFDQEPCVLICRVDDPAQVGTWWGVPLTMGTNVRRFDFPAACALTARLLVENRVVAWAVAQTDTGRLLFEGRAS